MGTLCLPLVFLQSILIVSCDFSTTLSTAPRNLTVAVGERVSFRCQTCSNVNWLFYDSACLMITNQTCSQFIYRESVANERLEISFGDCVGEFRLAKVQIGDSGKYVCKETNGATSKHVFLTVIDPRHPLCTFGPPNPVVGDLVSLICRVPEDARVSRKLSWYSSLVSQDQRLLQEPLVTVPGSASVARHVLRDEDNFGRFTCVAGSDLSGQSCSVVPLQVSVSYVRVAIAKQYVGPDGDLVLELECDSRAVPPMTRYIWEVRGNIPASRNLTTSPLSALAANRDVSAGRTLRISDVASYGGIGLTARCFAANDIGQNVTSDLFVVFTCRNTSVVTDPARCNADETDDLDVKGDGFFVGYLAVVIVVVAMVTASVVTLVIVYKRSSHALETTEQTDRETSGTNAPVHASSAAGHSDSDKEMQKYATIPGHELVGPHVLSSDELPYQIVSEGTALQTAPYAVSTGGRETERHPAAPLYARPNRSVHQSTPPHGAQPYAVISLEG